MPVVINGSTGISGTDGSASTPAVQGTDTNTGMFFPAADTIAFAEGGTEVMRIDSSGNMGIGTASPVAKLDVVSGADQRILFTNSSGQTLISSVNAANSAYKELFVNGLDIRFGTSLTERGRFDTSGNFQFNSGYGSVATAYGCRAWVNFNGTGTVAIRASGNVSSITDNGTGDYTVNFTTAMPDANYAVVTGGSAGVSANVYPAYFGREVSTSSAPLANSFRTWVKNTSNAFQDVEFLCFAIFR